MYEDRTHNYDPEIHDHEECLIHVHDVQYTNSPAKSYADWVL